MGCTIGPVRPGRGRRVAARRLAARLAAAAPFAVAVAAGSLTAQEPPEPLRVVSFNIRYGTADDGPDRWAVRRPRTEAVIAALAPEVMGVQEALRDQLDDLAETFPELAEIGVGRDDGARAGEYAAILYRRGVLEVEDSGTFWLSDTPEAPGSMHWGNRIPRITTWARLRRTSDGLRFYVFNAHWDHESQPSRERSAALMLERIRGSPESGLPVLVTGDFNAGEGNPAFKALVAHHTGLADTFRQVHPEAREVATFNGFDGRADGDKIDAVLASSHWDVLDAGIERSTVDGRYPSDHFPVWAVLRARPSAGENGLERSPGNPRR